MSTLMILEQVLRSCRYSLLPHWPGELSSSRISIDVPVGLSHESFLTIEFAATCFPNISTCIAEVGTTRAGYRLWLVFPSKCWNVPKNQLTDVIAAILELHHPLTGVTPLPSFSLRHSEHFLRRWISRAICASVSLASAKPTGLVSTLDTCSNILANKERRYEEGACWLGAVCSVGSLELQLLGQKPPDQLWPQKKTALVEIDWLAAASGWKQRLVCHGSGE